MEIFATEQLGPKQSLTPEGYLLCHDVAIARTGSQIYSSRDLPGIAAGNDGLITVIREESEVFRPETIASFEGKSVTVNHAFVDPHNDKQVGVGHAQNVRRSEVERDLLIADLLIKDAGAIERVRFDPNNPNKKLLREISCGYDAEYVESEPGVAYQRNIVGNHVALVERGRAGPRCSIQDSEELETMSKPTENKIGAYVKKLIRAARTGDAALIKRAADEAETELDDEEQKRVEDEENELKEDVAELKKTVDELTVLVKKLTKDGEDDENGQPKEKTGDEDEDENEEKKRTEDALRDAVSRAEILVPGFAMPTTDSVTTLDALATVQRKVLKEALKTEDGAKDITPLLAGRTVDALSADAVATVFVAASEMKKTANNQRGARTALRTGDNVAKPLVSAAEINKRNAEFYNNRK